MNHGFLQTRYWIEMVKKVSIMTKATIMEDCCVLGTLLSTFPVLPNFAVISLWSMCYYYPHCTEK